MVTGGQCYKARMGSKALLARCRGADSSHRYSCRKPVCRGFTQRIPLMLLVADELASVLLLIFGSVRDNIAKLVSNVNCHAK